MAEVGGQQGQSSLGILTGPVPLHEGLCRESVAHVVQTRAPTVGCASQTDLPRQRVERAMYVSLIQTIAPAGDEQIGRYCSSCPMSLTSGDQWHCDSVRIRGRNSAVEPNPPSRRGVSPRRAPRTGREPLSSSSSPYQIATLTPICQWAKLRRPDGDPSEPMGGEHLRLLVGRDSAVDTLLGRRRPEPKRP